MRYKEAKMWGEHEGMGWWMLFGSVWVILFWAVVLWAIVRLFGSGRSDGDRQESALEIAKRRYARGEISKEEYAEIRRELLS